MTPEAINARLPQILPNVQKPGRYTGGELNQVTKEWSEVPIRIALAFPDIYDLGMPNVGLAILYDIINKQPNMLAERTYAPWFDMEEALRTNSIPLYSLETKHPLRDFDLIGFSLPYEVLYTNMLTMLDLGGIPVRREDRSSTDPVVIAGGHATFNPEPASPFIDAFVIGEGEEIILEIANCVHAWKKSGGSRRQLYEQLAKIWGVYVPALYDVSYQADGTISQIVSNSDATPKQVQKRIVAKLPPPVTKYVVPFLDVTHNRAAIEIMRGCTRGCRFCQAGMITRPVRERTVDEIVTALEKSLDETGFDEVGLLSLSSSDYDHVVDLVRQVHERLGHRKLNISLPSLRIESLSVELMDMLEGKTRRNGFTLAPEAATERMREIINKPVPTAQVLSTAREIYSRGWHLIKLYFMIGHPSETLEDVKAIADLALAVLREGDAVLGKRAKVNVGVSTFIPKPHTPFQWVPCDTEKQVRDKQALLRRELNNPRIKLSLTETRESNLEAWLSRGDRRIGEVIHQAWKNGAKFDAWSEHYNYDTWLQAFSKLELEPSFYTHRTRATEEVLPWDHIDCAVDKKFLVEDYQWSLKGTTRVDCRNKCFTCGILPKFKEIRRENPGDVWECPDVGKSADKIKKQTPGSPIEVAA